MDHSTLPTPMQQQRVVRVETAQQLHHRERTDSGDMAVLVPPRPELLLLDQVPQRPEPAGCRSAGAPLLVVLLWSALLLLFSPPSLVAVRPLRAEAAGPSSSPSVPPLPPGVSGQTFTAAQRLALRETVREMFWHGYGNYMRHAHPHDELKPLSRSWTDSLAELGNAARRDGQRSYSGVALTQIDSLSTLAVMGEAVEFRKAVKWISENIHFDHDVRVHVFELNIRLLGGLLSAHLLASDASLGLYPDYNGELLPLAKDLGDRFLPAFKNVRPYDEEQDEEQHHERAAKASKPKSAQLPYAWVNLRHGVEEGETAEQCTACIGTLLLEFGMLSHLTNDTRYYDVVERALFALWERRDPHTGLLGNSLSCLTGDWFNTNAGIGAGIDSAFEYLFKSYVLFGNAKWLHMFQQAEESISKHLKFAQHWFVESDMRSGQHTHVQFNSLAAFWPGLQTMYGDWASASATHAAHFGIWHRFDALPERMLLNHGNVAAGGTPHSTERHYILRPELMESTYLLYRATRNPAYLEMGARMVRSLQQYARVPGGFAGLANVEDKQQKEDRMHSFFLAETLKYLYLLFDEDNFVHAPRTDLGADGQDDASARSAAGTHQIPNYVFTTEGHPFPVLPGLHVRFGDVSSSSGYGGADGEGISSRLSPALFKSRYSLFAAPTSRMNADTRRYHKRWARERGVSFQRMLAQAQSPRVTRQFQGPGEDGAAAPLSDFLRLHRAIEQQRRLGSQCFPDATSHSTYGAPSKFQPQGQGGEFAVRVGEGAFSLRHAPSGELLSINHLGTQLVEITNVLPLDLPLDGAAGAAAGGVSDATGAFLLRPVVLERSGRAFAWKVVANVYNSGHASGESAVPLEERRLYNAQCAREWDALGPFFGPVPTPLSHGRDASAAQGSVSDSVDDEEDLDSELEDLSASESLQRFSSYNSSTFLTAPVALAHPRDGCSAGVVGSTAAYRGRIVLLARGGCTFMDKLVGLAEAGAAGAIVINDAATEGNGDAAAGAWSNPLPLLMMGSDASGRAVRIPSAMLPRRYGDELLACMSWHERMQERELSASNGSNERFDAAAWRKQHFHLELVKFELPSTSPSTSGPAAAPASGQASLLPSTASSGMLHPAVVGDPAQFTVTSLGGFTVEVKEQQGKFVLRIY